MLIPLAALVIKSAQPGLGRLLGSGLEPARRRLVQADVRHVARRRDDQRGVRVDGRLDAGPLHDSRQEDSSTR